jgi:hypothetical protein
MPLNQGPSAVIRDVFGKSAFDKAVETGNMAVAAALLMHASRTEDCCVEVSTNGLVIDGLQVEGKSKARRHEGEFLKGDVFIKLTQ